MQNIINTTKQLTDKNLFNAFLLQLIKDFEQSNFPIEGLKDLNPDYHQIHRALEQLLQNNEFSTQHNIMQLIYRIDISEHQLAKYLNENKDRNYFDVIAELIIKRVLQKVVLKKQFKDTNY
jgi:hypothetical protein